MPIRPVRLAMVDDHVLFRKTLASFLSEQMSIELIVQASDMAELFSKLAKTTPDVLVMDIFLPHLNGNDALKMLRTEYPSMKILVLSMSTDMYLISDMLEAGIHGYISKADEPADLLRAISAVSEDRIYRNRLLTEALYWNRQSSIKTHIGEPHITLSEREKKILQMIWEEKSNKEIAEELILGVRSVEKIRQDLKEKLQVKSTVGLLKYAINKKIIVVDEWQLGVMSVSDKQ